MNAQNDAGSLHRCTIFEITGVSISLTVIVASTISIGNYMLEE